MRVRKELEPEPWVGAESSWGKVVVVSNYAQASKPASQTQHRTRNQTGILGAIKHELSLGSTLAFLRDFKRTCNSWPFTVQMLLLTNLVACYLLMPTEDWVPATRWLPVHQSNVIWSEPWILLHTHWTLASLHGYSLCAYILNIKCNTMKHTNAMYPGLQQE